MGAPLSTPAEDWRLSPVEIWTLFRSDAQVPTDARSIRLPEKEEVFRVRKRCSECSIQLVIVDEVGYIPFDPEAGALFFALISSRYERRSLVLNSNKTFSACAEIFGDPVAVAAMVDRLAHHAEVIVLRGDSYRLKGKGKEVLQPEAGS